MVAVATAGALAACAGTTGTTVPVTSDRPVTTASPATGASPTTDAVTANPPAPPWCTDVELAAIADVETHPDGSVRLRLAAADLRPRTECALPRDIVGVDVRSGGTWTEVEVTSLEPGTSLPDEVARWAITDVSFAMWIGLGACEPDRPPVDAIRVRLADRVGILLDPVARIAGGGDTIPALCEPVAVSPVFTFRGYG